jgi:hypothetical protein
MRFRNSVTGGLVSKFTHDVSGGHEPLPPCLVAHATPIYMNITYFAGEMFSFFCANDAQFFAVQ